MTDNYDQLALSWVRKEINNTLDQARQGLENFVENSEDQTQIQFCMNCLHQVQGTLQMLEFVGAAQLANEMETLAHKIAESQLPNPDNGFEVLMRSILQMPGYLERVEEGQKDIPLVLLPLINELRAASGLAPVTEDQVFRADVADVQPPKPIEAVSETDKTSAFHSNAKKLRAHFQKGLTGIIRGQNIKECLARIHKVLLRLEALTEGRSVARLWWVADGFIFAIAENGYYKKKEVHQLLAQVDKQIKRLADAGLAAQDDVIDAGFLSKLLYYVARSKSSNERVQSLKREFRLEQALPEEEKLEKQQHQLARPDSTAVTNVVEAINEELATVKDQLDLFVRSQVKDPGVMQSLVESLIRIADTLTLLELAIPRDVIRQQIKQLQKLMDLNKMPDDGVVMDVAGALLFVEANLSNIHLDDEETAPASEEDAAKLSQQQAQVNQVDEATKTLIKVARKSLQLAKDGIINYIASSFSMDSLENVPNLLQEVMGGIRIIQLDEAADMLQVAHDYVADGLLGRGSQPDEAHLDALADIITSVEYFLEASEEGRQGLGSILKGAQASHDLLADSLMQIPDMPEPVEEPRPAEATNEATEVPKEEEPSAEPAEVIPFLQPAKDKQADETLIDNEVLEIFLEEAEEEIESISEMLPRWRANTNDEDALTTVRRSFHTLKGSGRLVGATSIGEMAWAIENMLNKVIQESIPADPPMIKVVEDALALLPAMVEAFAKQSQFEGGDKELIARAEHLAEGRPIGDFSFAEPGVEASEAEPEVAVETSAAEEIDPVLLDIFVSEAEGHLQSIADYVKNAPVDSTVAVTDELIRALHTLKGSANMAGINQIGDLTGPLEKYARLVKGSGQRFEPSVVSLLSDCRDYLEATVGRLRQKSSIDESRLAQLCQQVAQLKASGTSTTEGSSAQQRDQRLVSIFLTEGHDILQEVASLHQQLRENEADSAIRLAIQREVSTLAKGAETLAIEPLTELAAAFARLVTFGTETEHLELPWHQYVEQAHQSLTDMLNRLASEEDILPSGSLVEDIDRWIESAASADAPEDMDQELVELFVEEADELLESARELFVRWRDNLNSKDINGELRRIYHTFKGSSRMAGAMAIGDLAYAAEDMFNTVLEGGRQQSELDFKLIEATTNKLEEMVNLLRHYRWPEAAVEEEQLLRRHLAGEPVSLEKVAEFEAESTVEEQPEILVAESETQPVDEAFGAAEAQESEASEVIESEPVESDTEASESAEVELHTESEDALEEPADFGNEYDEAVAKDDIALTEAATDSTDKIAEGTETSVTEDELVAFEEAPESEVEIAEASDEFDVPVLEDSPDEGIEFEETEILASIESDEINETRISDETEATLSEEPRSADTRSEEPEELSPAEVASEEEPVEISEQESATNDVEVDVAETEPTSEQTDSIDEITIAAIDEQVTEDSEEETESVSVGMTDEMASDSISGVQEDDEDIIGLREELIESQREKVPEVVAEETIAPGAPLQMTGNVQKVELDEDGEEVLEIYLEEADELLLTLDESLNDWAADQSNKDAIDNLQRTLHTFKGGARLSDLMILGDLTHEMETYFERVNAGQLEAQPEDVEFMLRGYDTIANLVAEVRNYRQMTRPNEFMSALEKLIEGDRSGLGVQAAVAEPVQPEAEPATASAESADDDKVVSFEKKKQEQEEARRPAQQQEVVRVNANQLEELVNLAGETSIFRSRLEQQMSELRYNLVEMSSTIERLREQLRNLDIETDAQIAYRKEVSGAVEYEDFDPLEMDRYTRQQELTRGLSESAVDLMSLKETLDNLTSDSETLLLQQGRVNTEMQESLMRTRMIPFESLVPRLRRMVRQISTELGKTIALSISAEGEMDRSVLERMIAPLEHMLRNAMDHGIESPEERKALKKPETGTIKISLYREGSEVFIKIEDDGRGLNLEAIRRKAIERGIIKPDSDLSDHELAQLILEAGFSTAEKVTQISGRGVGMDVVNSEIKHMGGVIEIDSKPGKGSTFTVRLPFTVSVNQALMVRIGEEIYAIPLSNIEGIVRVSPFELEDYYQNPEAAFEYAGINYHMHYLGQLLDHNEQIDLQGITQPLPVLLLHGADHPTALQVDELLGSREIVVKSVGTQLSSISGLSGATILGDGRVVLILDMPALLRRIDAQVSDTAETVETVVEESRVPKIMVVDDSITVRKVTTRLLERHDFEVITAKDGVDAVSVLADERPDVMLLDIEMPRMDGFELATIIRHDEKLKYLPIIMITSRTGEKHRERAEAIGVNRYMGKPYNEVDLIETITELLPNKA